MCSELVKAMLARHCERDKTPRDGALKMVEFTLCELHLDEREETMGS